MEWNAKRAASKIDLGHPQPHATTTGGPGYGVENSQPNPPAGDNSDGVDSIPPTGLTKPEEKCGAEDVPVYGVENCPPNPSAIDYLDEVDSIDWHEWSSPDENVAVGEDKDERKRGDNPNEHKAHAKTVQACEGIRTSENEEENTKYGDDDEHKKNKNNSPRAKNQTSLKRILPTRFSQKDLNTPPQAKIKK